MSIYAFLALINALVSLIIGIFVYAQNKRSAAAKRFSLFALSVVIWGIGYFLWQVSKNPEAALFWVRFLMAGAILIPILNFHFVVTFLKKETTQKLPLLLGYALFAFFFFANATPFFVKGVEPKMEFPFWPEPGMLFHPFLLLWFLYVAYGVFLLLRERAKAAPVARAQIEYILFATAVGYGGGITNFFLWYDIPISPIGLFGPALYVGIVAYAMVTQRLFGIRLFLTQLLVAFLSLLLLINVILSRNLFEYLWKGTLFGAFLIAGYLLVKSVMNEIKQREELQKTYRKLQELDKAKSEFLSIASHQLRAPLTAIKGYLSMLMEGTYGTVGEQQKRPMQNVYDSNERMIKLVNDLLNISRIESGRVEMKMEEGSVEEILESVVQELQVKAHEKRLDLVFERPTESLPLVRIDREKMRNVVLNLVDNAIHYTEKGRVTV
ncbi:MAG: histidine kinase N-terminal 7TM domain-containing protein, partial [bacterium]|nr:histidine kinase N-terminal 7TM domain-containing protein [bacterium]